MAWYNPTDPKQRNWMLGGIACLVAIVPFQMYLLAPVQEDNRLGQDTHGTVLVVHDGRVGILLAGVETGALVTLRVDAHDR